MLPGPSQLERVDRCLLSECLPHAGERTEWTDAGNARHNLLADVVDFGPKALEQLPPALRRWAQVLEWEQLPPLQAGVAEASFCLNVDTGAVRCLGQRLEREQARALATHRELVGTVDWHALADGRRHVVVVDWKGAWGKLVPAARNRQVASYAAMVARYHGATSATAALARLGEDGHVAWDRVELSAADLARHEEWVRALVRRREVAMGESFNGTMPTAVAGEHCDTCPALRFCPAQTAHLRALAGEEGLELLELLEQHPRTLAPGDVARAWVRLERVGRLLPKLEAALEAIVLQRSAEGDPPVELEDGRALHVVPTRKETILPEPAQGVLDRIHGDGFTAPLVKREPTLTWGGVEEGLRARLEVVRSEVRAGTRDKSQGTLKYLKEQARSHLRAAGAVATVHGVAVRAKSAKRGNSRGAEEDDE